MYNQAVDNYVDALEYVLHQYKTPRIGDKAVNIHPSVIQFVPECFKTQKMCDKAVNTCPFVFDSIPDQLRLKKCVMEWVFLVQTLITLTLMMLTFCLAL